MSRGRVGRPHYPRLNAPRRRFVVFRYDGDEVTLGDLVLIAAGFGIGYLVLCVWLAGV